MKKVLGLACIAVLLCGLSVQATTSEPDGSIIVESVSSGKNYADYLESPTGWPNSWAASVAKSTADGLTGTGSRYNSTAAMGAWFEISPVLTANPLGEWELYVTTTSVGNTISRSTTGIVMTGATGLPATTDAFGTASFDDWALVGTFAKSDAGQVTIRFTEDDHDWRLYADGVKLVPVPEPATLILLVAGGLFLRRRRG